MTKLLTARELAAAIGVKPGTVLDWWEAGQLPGYKFGSAVRFNLDEVLQSGRRESQPGGVAPSSGGAREVRQDGVEAPLRGAFSPSD